MHEEIPVIAVVILAAVAALIEWSGFRLEIPHDLAHNPNMYWN